MCIRIFEVSKLNQIACLNLFLQCFGASLVAYCMEDIATPHNNYNDIIDVQFGIFCVFIVIAILLCESCFYLVSLLHFLSIIMLTLLIPCAIMWALSNE